MLLLAALVLGTASCEAPGPDASTSGGDSASDGTIEVIREAFLTPMEPLDNVDSPAAWQSADGETLLLATAKDTHVIMAYDGVTGELMGRWGEEGAGPGQFQRPNGILVHDDHLVVVERDNRRVQVLSLPDFESLGTFGEDVLLKPYGVTGVEEDGVLHLWVTDDFDVTGEGDARWEHRVKRFAVDLDGPDLAARFVGTIGAPDGRGRLNVVESILADPVHGRLFIADEDEAERVIKVYDLDGGFTDRVVGDGVFEAEPEGIALYACGSEGYLLMADQSPDGNRFQVFDRVSLDHLGTFAGEAVSNTDGVAVLQGAVGALGSGAFYAVHDDQGVVGFRWSDVAGALGLRTDCDPGTTVGALRPWPGPGNVEVVSPRNEFEENLSGLTYEPSEEQSGPGTLWAVRNGPSNLYRLVPGDAGWTVAEGGVWTLRYPDGSGVPDAEGVTRVPSGTWAGVYVATERNNEVRNVSRKSVLRFEPGTGRSGGELRATHEWDLTSSLPATGPNRGIEAIAWIPDHWLVDAGFVDPRTGDPYVPEDDPAASASRGGGLFVVGVEDTGSLHIVALDHDTGAHVVLGRVDTGLDAVMGLFHDEELGDLWAACDDVCEGRIAVLRVGPDGTFGVDRTVRRPAGMPDLNNEGIVVAPLSECVNGLRPFYWTDDDETGGYSIRRGAIRCPPEG